MAAELLLTFGINMMLEKVGSIAADGITRAWGLKSDLLELSESTKRIQAVLQDAENNQGTDKRVKAWLLRLQDVLYSAEDVLDEFSYETLRHEVGKHHLKPRVRNFVSRNNPVLVHLNMAQKVKMINESLASIETHASSELALRGIAVADGGVVWNYQLDRVTDSFIDKSETMIGRASEVEAIINMLQVGSSDLPLVTFVSIVGIGGLGKTTLAKLVIDEVRKVSLFDETVWVCVSDTFDNRKILGEMLETVDKNTGGLSNIDAILQHLRKKLENKKFLLVLDDVWNENSENWKSLKGRLRSICSGTGNFAVVTTRRMSVAKIATTGPENMLELKQLQGSECWSIMKEKLIGNWGESTMLKDLETIGMEIAEKCAGVPLAAKVLGGTLCLKRSKKQWLAIRDSNGWDTAGKDNLILHVLKLSFDHLHPPLKSCFAHCSIFPKDFLFEKDQLVQLWMAEGFLNEMSTDRSGIERSMEDVGNEYLNNLLVNSFFQDVQLDANGNINKFKMHDLLHDLALYVSNYKMLELDNSSCSIYSTFDGQCLNLIVDPQQRLKFFAGNQQHPCFPKSVMDDAGKIRNFFSNADVLYMLPNFKNLRSLDISDSYIKELSAAIGTLKHLRYVDLSRNVRITKLPESITKLYNLQTMRIIDCKGLQVLPTGMKNLVSLRHIVFNNKNLVLFNVGHLTSLRTLPSFVVGIEEGYKIYELEALKELTGELEIVNLEHVIDGEEASKANLKKKKLSKLNLIWEPMHDGAKQDDVLEGLEPPQSIRSLAIEYYMGKQFPKWMPTTISDSLCPLNELMELRLISCMNCEVLPTLGHLPRLKILEITGMDKIKCLGREFYGQSDENVILFPALKKLSIKDMKGLVEWEVPAGIEDAERKTLTVFPVLEKLLISNCPHLVNVSSSLQDLGALKKLKIYSCRSFTSPPMGLASLEHLLIENSSNFSSDAFRGLSSLQYLEINHGCMEYIPNVGDLASLKSLKIEWCTKLKSLPADLHLITSLQTLSIEFCYELNDLSSIAFSRLENLEELKIYKCRRVSTLPREIKCCTSLQNLSVHDCQGLKFIDDEIISSLIKLKKLSIGAFSEELCEFPGLNLIHPCNNASLEEVALYGWNNLNSLPHQLNLTALKVLYICKFDGIETLPDWLKDLSSLQRLVIHSCYNLKNIPSAVKHLSKLTSLEIWSCPLLMDIKYECYCWPYISHISSIQLDGRAIQHSKS